MDFRRFSNPLKANRMSDDEYVPSTRKYNPTGQGFIQSIKSIFSPPPPPKPRRASKSWWYFYYESGQRPGARPKEMSGPFATKADADAKKRGEVERYGREPGARYVVRQLTTSQAERVWGGPVG